MNKKAIELFGGFNALYNEEDDVYTCTIPWLARDIEVVFSSGDFDDQNEIDGLKTTFERFWNDKENLLRNGQNEIKEKLLPYIAKEIAANKNNTLIYPEVSADDFDAEYWLDRVCIIFIDGVAEIQLDFDKTDDPEHFDELSVSWELSSGSVSFIAGLMPVYDIE